MNFRAAVLAEVGQPLQTETLELRGLTDTDVLVRIEATSICHTDVEVIDGGCGVKLGLVYAVSPRLARYSRGLSEPREILMRFSLYQWMYASTTSMNCSMVAARQSRG